MFRNDLRNVNGITFSSLSMLPVIDLPQIPIDLSIEDSLDIVYLYCKRYVIMFYL